MPKTSRLLPLLLTLLGFSIGILLIRAADEILLSGNYGEPNVIGTFNTGGNAGILSFDLTPAGYSGAQITGYGSSGVTLTGIFWLETAGWSSFGESLVSVIPPPSGNNIRDPWYLSGYAWSDKAGWISLNHGESAASGVAFYPDSRKLGGFGWNDMLGWVPFGDATGSGVDIEIEEGFIGKVDVVGSIGGAKTFDVLYEVGGSFNNASMTAYVNLVRKNISFLFRNAGTRINTDITGVTPPVEFNDAMIFQKTSNPSGEFLTYSDIQVYFDNDLSRSLIVVGADIYIDTDVTIPALLTKSRAILALKNAAGQGGNIWIKGSVKNINSVIYAERTLYSGEEFVAGYLSPYYTTKASVFTDIPRNQLYIKGAIGSYNTIGGSSKDSGAVCPYLDDIVEPCTYDTAVKYDLNYFRIYNGTPSRRAYPNSSKDEYSFIVEYDPRTILDPPPGLETEY